MELGSLGTALEVELEKLGMQKHPTILQKCVLVVRCAVTTAVAVVSWL